MTLFNTYVAIQPARIRRQNLFKINQCGDWYFLCDYLLWRRQSCVIIYCGEDRVVLNNISFLKKNETSFSIVPENNLKRLVGFDNQPKEHVEYSGPVRTFHSNE